MNLPEVSIVLATQNSAGYVRRCLDSLRSQLDSTVEVIVADASSDGTEGLIREAFPEIRLLHFAKPLGMPELLREALQNARGRVVTLIDPGCVFPPDWLERLRRAHKSEYSVIGGAVENGNPDGMVSWACYMVDYYAFTLPARRHVTPLLPGIHLSYKKRVLDPTLDSMPDGFWKVFLHSDLTRRGIPFLFEPDLVTYYSRPDSFLSFLQRYYRRGWYFAAMRCKRMSPASRFLHVIGFPALPLILFSQRIRAGIGKKSHRAEWLLSLPIQAIFLTGWALGECIGFLLGPTRLPAEVYQ